MGTWRGLKAKLVAAQPEPTFQRDHWAIVCRDEAAKKRTRRGPNFAKVGDKFFGMVMTSSSWEIGYERRQHWPRFSMSQGHPEAGFGHGPSDNLIPHDT